MTDLRYTDEAGRFMSGESLGRVTRRKTGVLFANLFLNAFHFVLWWIVLWLGMRFALWHALGIAFALWIFAMVAVQPVLFGQTRPKEVRVASTEGLFGKFDVPIDFDNRNANGDGREFECL